VQRLLRHSDPAITTEVYGHLDVEDMRRGTNPLAFQAAQPAEAPQLAAGDAPPSLAAGLLGGDGEKRKAQESSRKSAKLLGLFMVGETGFEPVDTGCPKPATAHALR
jgi:hypothetical protein